MWPNLEQIQHIDFMHNYILILILSTLPIIEARFGFAVGYKIFQLPTILVAIVAYIGNIISITLFTYGLYFILNHKKQHPIKDFVQRVVNFIKQKHQSKIDKFAFISLILFIGIPLPMSGSYTGIVIGYLIGLKKEKVLLAALLGTLISLAVVGFTVESIDISSKFFVKLIN